MKKIIIEDVQVGVSAGGIACGPVDGHVVVEARIRRAFNKVSYCGLVDVFGTVNFYEADESIYDLLIEDEADILIPEMEGYGDYNEFYQSMEELAKEDKAEALLMKYLVVMALSDWGVTNRMKKDTVGKRIGTFSLPICDAEEEYLENCAEEYET